MGVGGKTGIVARPVLFLDCGRSRVNVVVSHAADQIEADGGINIDQPGHAEVGIVANDIVRIIAVALGGQQARIIRLINRGLADIRAAPELLSEVIGKSEMGVTQRWRGLDRDFGEGCLEAIRQYDLVFEDVGVECL